MDPASIAWYTASTASLEAGGVCYVRMNCVKLVGAVAAAPLGRGRSEKGVGVGTGTNSAA